MNISEILSLQLRTIKVNKGKFTLEIGPLNGCHAFNTRSRCIDATTVMCARLQLFSILSDICHINLNQYWRKNIMILDWENKREWEEWGLEKGRVLVRGRFFSSCSLRSFFLASILKVIATASNLPAFVGSRSVGSVYYCFPIAPQDI